MLLRGEGLELGFSDGELVEAQESPSSGKVYSFGAGLMSLSVPERSISLSGKGSKSGSARASIPESEWDIIRSLKSGVMPTMAPWTFLSVARKGLSTSNSP